VYAAGASSAGHKCCWRCMISITAATAAVFAVVPGDVFAGKTTALQPSRHCSKFRCYKQPHFLVGCCQCSPAAAAAVYACTTFPMPACSNHAHWSPITRACCCKQTAAAARPSMPELLNKPAALPSCKLWLHKLLPMRCSVPCSACSSNKLSYAAGTHLVS
jgi:hypothetical protein